MKIALTSIMVDDQSRTIASEGLPAAEPGTPATATFGDGCGGWIQPV